MSRVASHPAPPGPPARCLIARVADGDLTALGQLYDGHAGAVRRFLMRATQHLDVADDLLHDTFLALVSAAPRFDPQRASQRAFIMGIAAKMVLRRRRRLSTNQSWIERARRWLVGVDHRTPERLAAADEQLARYQAALLRLPESKRVTVLLADVEGLTGPEIAAALGIPVGTVWTRLHHGREALRSALRDQDEQGDHDKRNTAEEPA